MELKDFLILLRHRVQTVISITLIFLVIGSVIIACQSFKYEAKSKLLITERFTGATDPYVAAKFNDYINSVLAKVASSNTFYTEVINANGQIDQSYFPDRVDKRMKKWGQTIDAQAGNDSGILQVSIYHTDSSQALQIAQAANNIFMFRNQLFHGFGDMVEVKVIDEPIVSRWPVKPNIPLNLGLSVLMGLIVALGYVYLLPDDRFQLRLSLKKPALQMAGRDFSGSPQAKRETACLPQISKNNSELQNTPRPDFKSPAAKIKTPAAVPSAKFSRVPDNLPMTSVQEPSNAIGREKDKANISAASKELSLDDIVESGDINNIFRNSL